MKEFWDTNQLNPDGIWHDMMLVEGEQQERLPGGVSGVVGSAPVVTKLHSRQQVLLGERHVHLILQGLVQYVGVGQGGSLRSLSGQSLPPPAPPRVGREACFPRHVFVD